MKDPQVPPISSSGNGSDTSHSSQVFSASMESSGTMPYKSSETVLSPAPYDTVSDSNASGSSSSPYISDTGISGSRRASNLKKWIRQMPREIASYFNMQADLLPQEQAEADIRSGVSFKGSQLVILIFAIFVASLGLNTNSIPVIIGAMLISPLMGPIMGIGLGIGIQDFALLRRALKNIAMAMLGSILASAIYFLISPQYEGASQLLARTSPSIYDVFIALFGGAAGIVSVVCRNKGQVMPGVAIATSLMPPLCTAGYGLATMQMTYFLGALYLFFTNALFILFASWIGVKLVGYKPISFVNPKRAHKVRVVVYSIVTVTIGISVVLTVLMIRKSIFIANASAFVEKEFVFPNTQVFSHSEYVKDGRRYIDVNLIGQALPMDSLKLAMMTRMNQAGLGGTILTIKQGVSISALNNNTGNQQTTDQFAEMLGRELTRRQTTIDSLRSVIALDGDFTSQGPKLAPEIRVLFPTVKDIALARMMITSVDSVAPDTVYMAFVKAPDGLSADQRRRLAEYLNVRTGVRTPVRVTVNSPVVY